MTTSSASEVHLSELRPVERVISRLAADGMPESEIAWRFRRTPGHIRRVLELTRVRRPSTGQSSEVGRVLRPIERLVLRARRDGADSVEIAARLRRSPRSVDQIERLASYKLEQLQFGW